MRDSLNIDLSDIWSLGCVILEMLTQLIQETHPTACGMSGPPVQAVTYSMLKAQMEAMKQ